MVKSNCPDALVDEVEDEVVVAPDVDELLEAIKLVEVIVELLEVETGRDAP